MNPSRERDPETIRSDIDATRARMDETMDQLGDRLQPRHLLDEVLGVFRRSSERPDGNLHHLQEKLTRSADAALHAVADTVKRNPVPALLIGAGVAWMIYESRRERPTDRSDAADLARERELEGVRYDPDQHYDRPLQYPTPGPANQSQWSDQGGSKLGEPETFSEKSGGMKDKLSHVGEQAREKINDLGHRAGEKLHRVKERAGDLTQRVGERTREVYGRTRERVVTTADEHPLEVGLVCLAAGVVAGLALPTTNAVNRVAGPAADRLRDRARQTGSEMIEKTRHVARAAVTAAKEEARHQGLPEPLRGAPAQSDPGNPSA